MKKKAFWIVMLMAACVMGAYAQNFNINVNRKGGFGNYTQNNWITVVNNEALIKTMWEALGNRYQSFSKIPNNDHTPDFLEIARYLLLNEIPSQNNLNVGDSFFFDVGVRNQQGNYNNGYIIYFFFKGYMDWDYVPYRYSK